MAKSMDKGNKEKKKPKADKNKSKGNLPPHLQRQGTSLNINPGQKR